MANEGKRTSNIKFHRLHQYYTVWRNAYSNYKTCRIDEGINEWKQNITFMSSASFSTYVNRFSFRGRVELDVLPALPTRCIAEMPDRIIINRLISYIIKFSLSLRLIKKKTSLANVHSSSFVHWYWPDGLNVFSVSQVSISINRMTFHGFPSFYPFQRYIFTWFVRKPDIALRKLVLWLYQPS